MVGGGVVDGFTWSQSLDHKCSHSRMIPPSFICLIQTGALEGRAHVLAGTLGLFLAVGKA